jgi:hypothetical protein
VVAAHLDEGEIGESGVGELADACRQRLDVRSAQDADRDVVFGDELGRTGEGRGSGEFRVDFPTGSEATDLFVGTFDRRAPETATAIGGSTSGRSQSFAESTR